MDNQRGGIISKLLIIPVAAVCMAGLFFLGYYMGKRQARVDQGAIVVPLPEIVSKNIPTSSDYTFFKTLSDKDSKTVSIDLKPQPQPAAPAKTEAPAKQAPVASKASAPPPPKQQAAEKVQTASRTSSSRARYTLQTASYQERSIAEQDVRRLKQHGFAAFIVSSSIPGKGTWFRVRLGSFANRPAAEKLQKDLRSKEGITAVVLAE